jgi:hypothetical protein
MPLVVAVGINTETVQFCQWQKSTFQVGKKLFPANLFPIKTASAARAGMKRKNGRNVAPHSSFLYLAGCAGCSPAYVLAQ